MAGVVQATDGNLYGLTQAGGSSFDGVAFRISSNGSYSLLASFDASTGALPLVTLLQHTNGLLYGLADAGGAYSGGTFYSLNVGLKPFVSLVSFLGPVGTTIGILGQGFTGTKKVTFGGGSAAAFTVVSDTYLTATVPTGALTGFVAVRTPSGILKSNRKFIVSP